MKQYGVNFATNFTKKQVSVLYYKAKEGIYSVEKWFMNKLFDAADFYGMDNNRSMAAFEKDVNAILYLMFENNVEECQRKIDSVTEKTYALYSAKFQKNFDRNIIT